MLHAFASKGTDICDLALHEVHFFLGDDFLLTVHDEAPAAIAVARTRLAADPPATFGRGLDFVLYVIADSLVDQNFPLLDAFNDELEELEAEIFEHAENSHVQRIFQLKRALVQLRRVLSPQRDVVGLLSRAGTPRIQERSTLYFRDIYDHLIRLYEQLESARDMVSSVMEGYLSTVANRTNDITKQLTIFATIFLPLSFIVGFFGQNFEVLSEARVLLADDGDDGRGAGGAALVVPPPEVDLKGPRMPTFSIDGVPLHYLDEGSGLPVLLLHGFPLGAESFRPQLDALSAQVPADRARSPRLRPERREPRARSRWTGSPRDALALLDHLGIERAVVGGVSMGGYATMALLREDAGRVLGLLLVDTQAGADDEAGRQRREDTARAVLETRHGGARGDDAPEAARARCPARGAARGRAADPRGPEGDRRRARAGAWRCAWTAASCSRGSAARPSSSSERSTRSPRPRRRGRSRS